jgi:hypothetical protein
MSNDETRDDPWNAPGWREAANEYHQQRAGRTLIVETPPEHLKRLRRLLDDSVSLERAYAEINQPDHVAASTLMAAEYLVREGDPARMRKWLSGHTPEQRKAILQHLEQRRKARTR